MGIKPIVAEFVKQLIVQFSRAHESRSLPNTGRLPLFRFRVNWLTLVVILPLVVAIFVDRPEANTGNILKRLLADRAVPPVVMPRNANG